MDEKQFFTEKTEAQTQSLNCPSCKQVGEYSVRWIRRTKKQSLPPGAGEQDRARFKNARDYMIRADDMVSCSNPRCRRRIEITSMSIVQL